MIDTQLMLCVEGFKNRHSSLVVGAVYKVIPISKDWVEVYCPNSKGWYDFYARRFVPLGPVTEEGLL